ncbi:MFS transporter [bacterium I07]|nr:MFS transporter [bacterium I07]
MKRLIQWFKMGPEQPLLQDSARIDRIYKKSRLSVMLCITLGYGIAYTCRLALSVVKKPLIDQGIFTPEQLGMIGSAIFYGYAFGKLFNGFLADHANIKRFLPAGIFMSAVMNLTMGWTATLVVWIILWALNGWFQGFGAPGGIVALSQWYSNSERGRYYGIWSTAHSIGEGLTFVGSAALVSWFGWRAGFWGPGLLCIAVAGVMLIFLKDRPQTLGLPPVAVWKKEKEETPEQAGGAYQSTGHAQRAIFRIPAIWVLGLSSALMYMTRYAVNSWMILYLQEAKKYSLVEAGSIMGLNTLAGLAGCAAFGFISDKYFKARRPPVNLIVGIIEIAALVIIFFAPPGNTLYLTIAFVMYGFSINGLVTSLGGLFGVDIAPKRAAGAVMGFVGVFSYLGAAFQERISGHLIQKGMTVVDGVNQYDFSTPILFWIGSSIVSLLLAASLWKVKVRD